MSHTFKPSSGREYPIVPGYRAIHSKPSYDLAYKRDLEAIRPAKYKGFVSDAITFAMMLDMFRESGLHRKVWKRHLDIGGAEGHHAALFKASGFTRDSTVIDILSYENKLSKRFWFLCRFRVERAILRLTGLRVLKSFHSSNKFGFYSDRSLTYLTMPLWNLPAVDRMWQRDVFSLKDQYDIVTAFLCMEYFDYEQLFEKVAELLSDGGVFFFIVNYWWYPVNSTGVVGDIPYLVQRMTRDEIEEYFAQQDPQNKDAILKKYDYFHKGAHPVLDDYIEAADKVGLKLINCRRIIPNVMNSTRTPITPKAFQQYANTQLHKFVVEARRLNRRVSLLDLETGWVMCAFSKRNFLTDLTIANSDPLFVHR